MEDAETKALIAHDIPCPDLYKPSRIEITTRVDDNYILMILKQ